MAATNFNRLRAYARMKGAKVERTGVSACWDRSTRTIHIPSRLRGRDALYTLLHEIGHVLVDLSGRFDSVDTYVHADARSWRGRAWCVAEEWEAWEAGKNLAERMGIRFDAADYDRYAATYLAGYVHEAGTAPFRNATVGA